MISHHTVLFCLAFLTACTAYSADAGATVLARWQLGAGLIADTPVEGTPTVVIGQTIRATTASPARLELAAPLRGSLTLGPGARLTTTERIEKEQRILVLIVDAGAVQFDIDAKGPYHHVVVEGGAIQLEVTGTLFVVERVRRDADYAALIQGRLKASLKKDVADALGKHQKFDLESRQGIGGTSKDGLGPIQNLNNRPQVASEKSGSIEEQGIGDLIGDGFWDYDAALALLLELLEGLGLDEAIIAEILDSFSETLFEEMQNGPAEQVLDTVLGGGGFGVLGAPPPPPPF